MVSNSSPLVLLFDATEKLLSICQRNLHTSYFKLQTAFKHELEVKDYSECQLFKDMNNFLFHIRVLFSLVWVDLLIGSLKKSTDEQTPIQSLQHPLQPVIPVAGIITVARTTE